MRVVFHPFNELYEISGLKGIKEYHLVKGILPLFEGVRIFFIKSHLGRSNYPSDYLKGKERMVRLTPDLKRLEIRLLD